MTPRRPSESLAIRCRSSRPCRSQRRASRIASQGTVCSRSCSAAAGRITSSAKRRQRDWNSTCSSVRRKSIHGGYRSTERIRSLGDERRLPRSAPATLRRAVPRRRSLLLVLSALAVIVAGCGKDGGDVGKGPEIGKKGGEEAAASAAGVARAVYTGTPTPPRPPAVVLVDRNDWQGGIAAAVLMSPP